MDEVFKIGAAWTPPSFAVAAAAHPDEAAEVATREVMGLQKAICPKCQAAASPYEVSLWLDPEAGRVRFLCSGCRTAINRDKATPSKDQALMCLQAHGLDVPDDLIRWHRVQAKIAAHPGGATTRLDVGVEVIDGEARTIIREVPGGRTGIRATIGVVD